MNNKGLRTGYFIIPVLILIAGLLASCASPASPSETASTSTATAAAQTSESVIELTLTTLAPEPTTEERRMGEFTPRWIYDVEKATEGKVKIKGFYSNTLAPPTEHYSAVVNGRADICSMYTMMNPGMFPMTDVFTIPSPDFFSEHKTRIWWELYQQFPEMNQEYSQTKLLLVEVNGSYSGLFSNKPIRTMNDMKGLKVQAPGKWATEQMQTMGASPVSMPQTDVYMAMQTKVVDATYANWSFLAPPDQAGQGWGELAKYYTEVDLFDTPFYLAMNIDKWNSLPKDIQDKITSASYGTFADEIDQIDWTRHLQLRAAAKKAYGTESIWLEPDELAKWKKVMDDIQVKYAAELDSKGLPGTKLLQAYLQLCEKYKLQGYYGTN